MIQRPKPLYPHVIHKTQMKDITASLLYEGMREKCGLSDVRITLRGVRMIGPGNYIPASESEIVPDSKRALDHYCVAEFDWYMVEGTYDRPRYNPEQRMTRSEFLMEMLDRLRGFAESLKYSPTLKERVEEEVDIALHYIKGAYDIAELADLRYLEEDDAAERVPMPEQTQL